MRELNEDIFYTVNYFVKADKMVKACCDIDGGVKALLVLQRSLDGVLFQNVDNLYSDGASQQSIIFTLTDSLLDDPFVYYRLRFVFADGTFHTSESNILQATNDAPCISITPSVYPDNEIKMRFTNAPGVENILVVIYDSLGNEISSFFKRIREKGDQIIKCKLPEQLRSGAYKVVTSFSTKIFENTIYI